MPHSGTVNTSFRWSAQLQREAWTRKRVSYAVELLLRGGMSVDSAQKVEQESLENRDFDLDSKTGSLSGRMAFL